MLIHLQITPPCPVKDLQDIFHRGLVVWANGDDGGKEPIFSLLSLLSVIRGKLEGPVEEKISEKSINE